MNSGNKAFAILFADDAADSRLLVQACFRGVPVALTLVEDGAKAVEAYVSAEFDLIILDVEMPILSGPEALVRIREWETNHGLPKALAIALTGNDEAEGFDRHLKKPVSRARLFELLAELFPGFESPQPSTKRDPSTDEVFDEEIRSMMPGYLENRIKDLQTLTTASGMGDFVQCAAILHRIRGTAASYGFPGIGKIAERAELAAKAGDAETFRLDLRSLRSEVARRRVAL